MKKVNFSFWKPETTITEVDTILIIVSEMLKMNWMYNSSCLLLTTTTYQAVQHFSYHTKIELGKKYKNHLCIAAAEATST